jgi:hypothetical protein
MLDNKLKNFSIFSPLIKTHVVELNHKINKLTR